MGGNALKKYGVITERKDTTTFQELGQKLSEKLRNDLGCETAVVKCYHTKKDHGDLDLLIKVDSNLHNKGVDFRDYISKNLNPTAIHYNGGVYSFDHESFQVDFIPIKESNWEVAQTYFSYDPVGNLMGKTFHKFGLSYGWEGLYYKFRNFSGREAGDLLLTKDPRKIFEFGGYDYDRFLLGFETLDEIFDFIINSKYFDSKIFQFDNLNHIDKKRNKKRNSYNVFLNFLNNSNINTTFDFKKDKNEYLPMINDFFPEVNLLKQIEEFKEKDEINRQISEKFNGNVIMSWINVSGKELGELITKFRSHLGNDYKNFIMVNDINSIRDQFFKVCVDENK